MRFISLYLRWGPGGVHGRRALCGTRSPRAATYVGKARSVSIRSARAVVGVVCMALLGAWPLASQQPGRSGAWAIAHTTVIDGRGGEPLTDAVIIVDRGVARCVGSERRCPLFGIASVIDGSDLWVTPGLIDPDVELPWTTDSLRVQDDQHIRLAAGITLVRERGTAGEVESNLRARKRASDPFRPEPKILVTGSVEPRSARELGVEGLVATSRGLARRSVDGLRVTGREPGAQLDSIFRVARSWSLPVFGAMPGQRLGDEQVFALAERGVRAVDAPIALRSGAEATMATLAERDVAVTPAMRRLHLDGEPGRHIEEFRFLEGPRPVTDFVPFLRSSEERTLEKARQNAGPAYERAVTGLRDFREQGGTLIVGSGGSLPGSGLLVELELLQDSGYEPSELISLATHGAARELGVSRRFGSIRPGIAADLLLLEADPTEDIRNTRKVWRVVKSGVIYDPIQLLEPYRLRYERETKNAWKERAMASKWFAVALVGLAGLFWYRRKNAWRL